MRVLAQSKENMSEKVDLLTGAENCLLFQKVRLLFDDVDTLIGQKRDRLRKSIE